MRSLFSSTLSSSDLAQGCTFLMPCLAAGIFKRLRRVCWGCLTALTEHDVNGAEFVSRDANKLPRLFILPALGQVVQHLLIFLVTAERCRSVQQHRQGLLYVAVFWPALHWPAQVQVNKSTSCAMVAKMCKTAAMEIGVD